MEPLKVPEHQPENEREGELIFIVFLITVIPDVEEMQIHAMAMKGSPDAPPCLARDRGRSSRTRSRSQVVQRQTLSSVLASIGSHHNCGVERLHA